MLANSFEMQGNLARVVENYAEFETNFNVIGTSGYTVAMAIRNVVPKYSATSYPDAWVKQYVEKRYCWLDPVLQFTAFDTGVKRWSEITSLKLPILSTSIFRQAEKSGLRYGLAIVRRDNNDRTRKHLLSLARSDRELSDREIESAVLEFDRLIEAMPDSYELSARQKQVLTLFANGKTRIQVANHLLVSAETIKKESDSIRRMLGATNTTEAVGLAVSRKIINPYRYPEW